MRGRTMSVRGRLASYGLVLLAAFGIGVGLGELLPDRSEPAVPPSGGTPAVTEPGHDPDHDQHGGASP